MPSFDTVSEVDMHEVTNAIDQAKRELGNRWDFKNVDADIVLDNQQLVGRSLGLDFSHGRALNLQGRRVGHPPQIDQSCRGRHSVPSDVSLLYDCLLLRVVAAQEGDARNAVLLKHFQLPLAVPDHVFYPEDVRLANGGRVLLELCPNDGIKSGLSTGSTMEGLVQCQDLLLYPGPHQYVLLTLNF